MRTDYHNWAPVTVSDMVQIFAEIPVQWCIAGGWALDLYLGEQSREHADIDILIFRDEQAAVYERLSIDWTLYKADRGTLAVWEEGETLTTVGDVWVSKDHKAPFSFQIMLVEAEQNSWIYRREPSIKREMQDIVLRTDEGVPYLKPEIQLLYKGGSKNLRDKDQQDFIKLLPFLDRQAREWLTYALQTQFPGGHAWIDYIGKSM